jgi:alkanesulfonate monooxygenase SsuD/methylene tetrahydromethanopterin reductase-like flavin-dependent oxidoreductase (luciferase family)
MTFPVVITIAVAVDPADDQLTLADAAVVADTAQQAGAIALRLLDQPADTPTPGSARGPGRVLDPTVAAAYLAGRQGRIGYLVDVATTHQAPYNTARRVLSIDRATDGQVGIVLRAGAGDEVSDAVAAQPVPGDPAARWSEYAEVLARLWESFPRSALIGDQDAAVVADDTAIRPIDHAGEFYRVAGPLDGPSSRQGRPVLAVTDVATVGWDRAAALADVILVAADEAPTASEALANATERIGRPRREIALIGRLPVDARGEVNAEKLAERLAQFVAAHRLDGLELLPVGGVEAVLSVLASVVTVQAEPPGITLRDSLGVPEPIGSLVSTGSGA